MKRSITLLALVFWLGLGGSTALADLYFQAIGDPVESGSWSQTFATRAGDWSNFDAIRINITLNYSFEQAEHPAVPDLEGFFVTSADQNSPVLPGTSANWTLTTNGLTLAEAGAADDSAIGGLGRWLVFTANFDGALPTSHNHLKFMATLSMDGTDTWYHEVDLFVQNKQAQVAVKSFPASEVVPVPAALVLGLIGLGALGVWKRRYC